jgi:hypothetical protein
MKKAIAIVIAFYFLPRSYSQSNAPSVVNSAGGSSQSGYYQFEWSIGEMALIGQMNNSTGTLIITNGFIQPYILRPGAGNTGNAFEAGEIRIFPNPASSYVEINFFTSQKGRVTLDFFDMTGKKVYTGMLLSSGVDLVERISMTHLPGGIYALYIQLEPDAGSVSKKGVYKIIKAQ